MKYKGIEARHVHGLRNSGGRALALGPGILAFVLRNAGAAGTAHRLDVLLSSPGFALNMKRTVIKTILKILSLLPKRMRFIKVAKR